MKVRLLILWIHCLLLSVGARAQFGSDIGSTAISTLAWDHIVSNVHSPSIDGATIGLTTDNRIYVWGGNKQYTITAKRNGSLRPIMQLVPYYVPSPAGETIKKVRMMSRNVGATGYYVPTYFALSQSGKLYGWGINTGAVGTAWVVYNNINDADTTKTVRQPVALSILGESTFVDMDASTREGFWIAIGASGKAYHNGQSQPTIFQTTYTALPNPAGVDAATFKYTNVWVAGEGTGRAVAYLKGNDGKIYYTGPYNGTMSSGLPAFFNTNTGLTTAQASGNLIALVPALVPFPAGEDIVNMKITFNPGFPSSTYAFSASGKAFLAGFWRKKSLSSPTNHMNYTVTPLKAAPNSSVLGNVSTNADSTFYLKQFSEIATPPGATKILDIVSLGSANTENRLSIVIGDNYKAYWSGSALDNFKVEAFVGNYLSYGYIADPDYTVTDQCSDLKYVTANSLYSWEKEAINYHGAAKFFRQTQAYAARHSMYIISKTGRGYFVGNTNSGSGLGKLVNDGDNYFPTPIANEQLLNCQTSPGTGGPLTGPVTPTNTAVGTIDCSKTKLYPAPVAGVPSQLSLIVTVNVTTIGDFTPVTVSGSGMSLPSDFSTVSATTTGVQQFHIPLNYDGSALSNAFQFSIGSAGSCSADLTQKSNKQVTNVWSLTNCSAITPGVLSK